VASRNSVKIYIDNSFYHIYNRGVEKRDIFLDDQDYSTFLSYLQTYLSPKDEKGLSEIIISKKSTPEDKDKAVKLLRLKNYNENIELVCYALMPNHFHLLIRQRRNAFNHLMNSLGTRYGMYFNRKYNRIGVLFQDVYKAVYIETDEQLLHLSRYINLNPLRTLNLPINKWNEAPYPCSLPEYLNKRQTDWIKTHYILDYFIKKNPNTDYENFIGLPLDEAIIEKLAIDFDID